MENKAHGFASSRAGEVRSSQGGTNYDAGPNSASGPGACGDASTNSTQFTKQDNHDRDSVAPKNKFHEV